MRENSRLNGNKRTHQNLWDVTKAVVRNVKPQNAYRKESSLT